MNYLLIGNGFDLHYNLPTSYLCFLVTIDHLRSNDFCSPINVGEVFKVLSTKCKAIENSYINYKDAYDSLNVDFEQISTIMNNGHKNCWVKYLIEAYNEDVGWIDFENEINNVLIDFAILFDNVKELKPSILVSNYDSSKPYSILDSHYVSKTIKCFDYFYSVTKNGYDLKKHKKQFFKYDGFHDKSTLNKEAIIEGLINELEDLAKMIREYLKSFVEPIYKDCIEKSNDLDDFERVINFNYTKTFESVFFDDEKKICHLHGNVDSKLILGVNSNEDDEYPKVDDTFMCFKKYYQRQILRTNDKYFRFYREKEKDDYSLIIYNSENEPIDETYSVHVFGHSLDPNDETVIKMFFEKATHIVIYYHSEEARIQYIKNIIRMFGEKGFNELMIKKHLDFLPIEELFNKKRFKKLSTLDKINLMKTFTF